MSREPDPITDSLVMLGRSALCAVALVTLAVAAWWLFGTTGLIVLAVAVVGLLIWRLT